MNWLTRLFAPAKPPELSCFFKGLIRSMQETPEKWERNQLHHAKLTRWAYASPYISLWLPDLCNRYVNATLSDFPKLTVTEKKALTDALFEYLEKPYHAKAVEADKVRQRRLMAPFEKLGCPDQS